MDDFAERLFHDAIRAAKKTGLKPLGELFAEIKRRANRGEGRLKPDMAESGVQSYWKIT